MRHLPLVGLLLLVVASLAAPTTSVHAARPGAPKQETLHMKPVGTLGVAAASGLLVGRRGLRVVADDQTTLTSASRRGVTTGHRALVAGTLPTDHGALKEAKPDFESLAHVPGMGDLAIGSGSTTTRDRAVLVVGKRTTTVDLAPLYDGLRARFGDLNVEGAAVMGDQLALATRRSGSSGANRLVLLDLARTRKALRARAPRLGPDLISDVIRVELGSLRGVPLGFTDLTPHKGGALFTAAAEKTDDPVEDGVCVGSCVGFVSAQGKVQKTFAITPRGVKLEGIGLRGNRIVAVTDADDPKIMSPIFEAPLPRALR